MEDNIPVQYRKTIGEGLLKPYSITLDKGDTLWVAEGGGGRITHLDISGNRLAMFGKGDGGLFAKTGKLRQPAGIAVDKLGNCYVPDFKLDQVFKYDPQGTFIKSFGSHGKAEGQFNHCWGIKCDPDGNLWVVDRDNNRLQKFDPEGNFLAKIGKPPTEPLSEFERPSSGFNRPSDLAFDADGNLYVIDEHNYRVLKFDPQGNFIFKFGKEGFERGQFSDPRGIAIDSNDHIYITDAYLDIVLVFSLSGRYLYSFSGPIQVGGSFYRPLGIAVDARGLIYVCDNRNNRIMVFENIQ